MPRRVLSIAELEQALEARMGEVAELQKERNALAVRVATLDSEIADLEGAVSAPSPSPAPAPAPSTTPAAAPVREEPKPKPKPKPKPEPEPKREDKGPSLIDSVVAVLAETGEAMTAKELGETVIARGYKTKSKNLSTLIWAQIYKDPRVERPERGKFRLKATALPQAPAEDQAQGDAAQEQEAEEPSPQ